MKLSKALFYLFLGMFFSGFLISFGIGVVRGWLRGITGVRFEICLWPSGSLVEPCNDWVFGWMFVIGLVGALVCYFLRRRGVGKKNA